MATIAPPRHTALSQSVPTGKGLTEVLRSWRRRLWIQQMLRWAENGVIAGITLACLLLLISRLTPWADAIYWAIGVATASLLFASGAALWYRPSFARSAHLVDTRLALHDRLSTAWEFRDDSATISVLQRRDALRQLGKHTPRAAITLWPQRVRLVTFGAVVIVLALLLLLPNPVNTLLQQQAAFQNQLASQIAAINQIRKEIDNQAAISAQERNQIDKILREAMNQLQQAKNGAQAQQVLAQAQAKLNQLRDPQATSKAVARAAASSSLAKSSNANVSAAGKALATGDNNGLDAALQKLASQISSMTPAQRAQLAQQIEQSANQALNNPALNSALHQLAKAVADGSPGEISDANKAVETAAAHDSANQATTSGIDQASKTLQNVANTLASSTDNSNSQSSSQTQTPGQGQNPGQGQAPGQGQGINGTGGQNNAGNKQGKNEQVYVPGQVGSGTSTITANGENGTVQSGSPVPYSQVIAQYQQMAHDAIGNSSVPPDLKNLIRGYYNSLEGQQ